MQFNLSHKGARHQSIDSLRLPDAVHDLATPMAIDAKIRAIAAGKHRKAALAPEWQTERQAVVFGRRLAERVFRWTIGPHDERIRADAIKEWGRIAKAADDARDAMRVLLRELSPADPSLTSPAILAAPLCRMVREQNPDLSPKSVHQEAQAKAKDMLSTFGVLAALSDHLEAHRSTLAAQHQNPGEVEKAAFVMWSAAGWARLTGSPPGKGQDPESPFMGFLAALWSDLGGQSTSFDRMVKEMDKAKVTEMADAWSVEEQDGWHLLHSETDPA